MKSAHPMTDERPSLNRPGVLAAAPLNGGGPPAGLPLGRCSPVSSRRGPPPAESESCFVKLGLFAKEAGGSGSRG